MASEVNISPIQMMKYANNLSDSLSANMTELTEKITDLKEYCNGNKSDIYLLERDVGLLRDTVTEIGGKVNKLESLAKDLRKWIAINSVLVLFCFAIIVINLLT